MSDELVERHERVRANAARTANDVSQADTVATLGLMGETVEDLKARLPHMRDLHDWLVRIEEKIDRILAERKQLR